MSCQESTEPALQLSISELSELLPMHLLLAANGSFKSLGATVRKLVPDNAERFPDVFVLTRPLDDDDHLALKAAAQSGERVFLRTISAPHLTLRGNVIATDDGELLLNLGFGFSLVEAVQKMELKDSDFAPSELAMELLFLHEANRAVMRELSKFNLRLDEAREVAETQAFSDPLTGLYNRRGLEIALNLALRAAASQNTLSQIARPGSERENSFAVVHMDLDRFKEVNDRYGHAAGDQVLCNVARILDRETRSNDTVARVGGDEFVLILPGMVDAEALERLSKRIINEIERPIVVGDIRCSVSASIGVTTSSLYEKPSAGQMLEDADTALYASKNAGRARATLYGVIAGSGN